MNGEIGGRIKTLKRRLIHSPSKKIYTFKPLNEITLMNMSLTNEQRMRKNFGVSPDGKDVQEFVLKNSNGIEMGVLNYGGIIRYLKVPDRHGNYDNVVLGFDRFEDYLINTPYFGAIIGRYANRINGGKFNLNGQHYSLAQNLGNVHLHGGLVGFDKVIWEVETEVFEEGMALNLFYLSPHMEEGYSGNLRVNVNYSLKNDNSFTITYRATTDQATVLNLTQHSYFNLSGGRNSVLNHELMVNAASYLPVDDSLIPTGEIAPVKHTPFDFQVSKTIGQDIDHQLLKGTDGFDQNLVLKTTNDIKVIYAGKVYEPESGRVVDFYTSEPGVQIFTANFFDGSIKGHGGVSYNKYYGLCLETQHFPDSPNQPKFPSTELLPGGEFISETKFVFSVK